MGHGVSALLIFASILMLGAAGGALARAVRLPSLAGKIVVGILLGGAGFNLLPDARQVSFLPVASLAVSFIAVTVGGHLEFKRLHNALRRILWISVVQVTLVFAAVFTLFYVLNPLGFGEALRLPATLAVASLATSSSPVAFFHTLKEKRARGVLVKTAIAVLALNNLLTLVLFEVVHGLSSTLLSAGGHWTRFVLPAVGGELLAVAIGAGCAEALTRYCRWVTGRFKDDQEPNRHRRALIRGNLFTGFLVAICFASGLCETLTHLGYASHVRPSPILANMALGLVLANRSSFKDELLSLFDMLEQGVFTCFFVLAGSHFEWGALVRAGGGVALFVVARAAALWVGGWAGAKAGGATPRVARHIGPMLLSQGAIAIALVFLIEPDPDYQSIAPSLTAMIVAACVLSELIGPLVMARTLDRAGEAQRDRLRLMEFLQEEFIDPRLRVEDKWQAIESLSYFVSRTHKLKLSPREVCEAVVEREKLIPTGIGEGVAVPHARIPTGHGVVGVLAKLDPPIDFGAPDGQPAWLAILIATPEGQDHLHLEVIAAVARMMRHPALRDRIRAAETAEAIHEIIDSAEAETFNYFVEA